MGKLVSSVANIFTGADNTAAAGAAASAQQAEAAKAAAAAAAFRPVGMTTRFGSSQFTREIDSKTGMPYVSSAGYTAAPELAALQERLFGQFGQGLTQAEQSQQLAGMLGGQAEQLYGLGAGYLSESPEAARQRYISQQQALVGGQNEQALSGIRNRLFQTGRTGLATGGTTTGMQATNPELAAYYNALAQQNAQIAAGAEQAAQQQQTFGAGLLGTGTQLQQAQQQTLAGAYSPLQTLLGLSGNVENLAQMPYQLGIQLGQAAQPGQQAGSQIYNQGMSQAAQTQYQATAAANAANAGFWGGLIQGGATLGAAKLAGPAALAASDVRLKENIKQVGVLPSGLNLYEFEYKAEYKNRANTGHGKFIGVMAQEAEQVIPEAVSFDADGFRQVDYSLIH
jgi:hypothetical protein